MSEPPTWHSLPHSFKQSVVSSLDFASRHSLRLCSQSDFHLVEATPLSLNNVLIYLWTPPQFDFIINIIDNSGTRYKFTEIAQLKNIFNNEESKFQRVSFCLYLDEEDKCEKLEKIVEVFEKLKSKIKAEKFGWSCNSSLNGNFFKIFEKFQPCELSPFDCALSHDEVKRLVKMENFKKGVKKFETFTESDYDVVEDFHRVDQLVIRVPRMEIRNVWKVIKNFQSKIAHSGPDACFNISTTDEFPLEKFLEQLEAPTKNPEWDHNFPEYTQLFPTSSEKYHLRVEVGRFSVRGVFGHK